MVACSCFSAQRRRPVAGVVARRNRHNALECWNCKNGKVVWTLELGGTIMQLAVSANGSVVAAGTEEGELACLGSDGALRGEVQKLGSAIKQLAVSADRTPGRCSQLADESPVLSAVGAHP